jgi:hypothetical protein
MKLFRIVALALLASVLCVGMASAQSWTSLNNLAPEAVGPLLQLRDGRVLAHSDQNGNALHWYILTPDATGSYQKGTWCTSGSFPSNYSPFFFSTAVGVNAKLGSNIVIAEGGEYNFGSAVWTNLGALGTVTPFTCPGVSWAANSPPSGWARIGDAQNSVLPDGTYMQANCCTSQNAIFTGPNSWTATGSVNQGNNDESAFTALPNHLVLTVDTKSAGACGASKASELYDPGTGVWSCGPQLPVQLYNPSDEELGAAVLMYNGKVFQIGGSVSATAIYDPVANSWAAGPNPPNGMTQADGPAALEPNGKVLAMLGTGLFGTPCHFAEYDPSTNALALTVDSPDCPSNPAFVGHLMVLPTGQIAEVTFTAQLYLYNPAGSPPPGVAPLIIARSNVVLGKSVNNILYGRNLNGLSETNAYGDDYQAATNYPLIRFTNGSGNVWYGYTHDDSSHSIAPGTISYTMFDLNPAMPSGQYTMQVVTNGIGSNGVLINVP